MMGRNITKKMRWCAVGNESTPPFVAEQMKMQGNGNTEEAEVEEEEQRLPASSGYVAGVAMIETRPPSFQGLQV